MEETSKIWELVSAEIEKYRSNLADLPVAPRFDRAKLLTAIGDYNFETPQPFSDALRFVVGGMTEAQLHTAHPAYFGVFNPAPTPAGVAGEFLAAAFNPQLASYPSAPFAIELEQHLLRFFGTQFGYPVESVEGIFTSGGTEANHTAVLCALTHRFPDFASRGLRSLEGDPVIYVSSETHHSILKAARMCGLGTPAVREIPVRRDDLTFDAEALRVQIEADRSLGLIPFLVVATAGATSTGAIDDIEALTAVAHAEKLWIHLDAAWGGAVALVPEYRTLLRGAERCDSITFDTHKWLAAPMTAGMFLTRHHGILERTFRVDKTFYMPTASAKSDLPQPYAQSMSWSRRFLGLKVFLSLATEGLDGHRARIRQQVELGKLLKAKLAGAGWKIVNHTMLPVVCFAREDWFGDYESYAKLVAESGRSWLTTVRLSTTGPALRAGIANFNTTERELDLLVELLRDVNRQLGASAEIESGVPSPR